MGYTHYWRQYDGFNSDKWDTLVQHSLYLQAAVYPSVKLADVEMSDFQISFNGVAPQNHETFTLNRVMPPPITKTLIAMEAIFSVSAKQHKNLMI